MAGKRRAARRSLIALSLFALPLAASALGTPPYEAVAAALREAGAPASARPLLAATGGFGSSLYVDLPAAPNASPSSAALLAVAVPLRPAGDGSAAPPDYGCRVALSLVRLLAESPPAAPVRIAFLADERSTLPADLRESEHSGLRALADSLDEPSRTMLVYLDLPEDGGTPRIEYGTASGIAPRFLLESLISAFGSEGLPVQLAVPFTELFRLGLVAGRPELRLLRERQVSALLLDAARPSGAARPSDEARQPEDALAAGLANALRRLGAAVPEEDERYSLIASRGAAVILPEGATVAVFLLSWSLFLLAILSYSLTHRRLLAARWHVFLRRIWVIAGFLLMLALCVAAAGWTTALLLKAFRAKNAEATYAAAAVKLLLAFAFYGVFSPLFLFRAVPRRAHFYGSAALMLLALGALTAAALDFTFVPVFIWSFAMAFLASILHFPFAALIPTLLAPLQIIASAGAAVASGDAGIARAVLSGDLRVDGYLAFLALPFMFLFKRVVILARASALRARSGRPAPSAPRGLRLLLPGAAAIAALAAAAVFAARTGKAEAAPFPGELAADAARFSLRAEQSDFLESRTVRLRFSGESAPDRIDLRFIGDDKIEIYDAPVPFTLSDDGREADFALGEHPPAPLTLSVTIPTTLGGRFAARALFYDAAAGSALFLESDAGIEAERSP